MFWHLQFKIKNGTVAILSLVKDGQRLSLFFDGRTYEYAGQSHSTLTEAFATTARHGYLLSLPLTKGDIKAEALNILSKIQAQETNSPNRTHYVAQISLDFLARANTKDTNRLMSMLPFQFLSISTLRTARVHSR